MTVKYQVMKVATVMKAGVGWNKLVTVGRSWTLCNESLASGTSGVVYCVLCTRY